MMRTAENSKMNEQSNEGTTDISSLKVLVNLELVILLLN